MIKKIVRLIESLGYKVVYSDEKTMLDMFFGKDQVVSRRVHAYGLTTEDGKVYINKELTGNMLVRFLLHECIHVVRDRNRFDDFKGMFGALTYRANESVTEFITMCILKGLGINMWRSHVRYFLRYGMMTCQIRNHVNFPQYDKKYRDEASSIFTMIMKG